MTHRPIWIICLCLSLCSAALSGGEASTARYAEMVAREPDLAAYWRLEGDLKDAKGGLDGKPGGRAARFADGPKGGRALALGEGRFVTMGETPALDLAKTTVELWFRGDFAPNVGYNPCLIAKRSSHAATRFSIHLWRDYSCLAFWNGRQVVRFEPVGRALRRGEWHHLVVTCEGDDLRFYLDGLRCRRASGSGAFTWAARGLPLQIGSSTSRGAEQFDGLIDEVAVYSRALAVEEIERHMDAMGAKRRITRREAAAEAQKRRRARDADRKELLAKLMTDENLLARGQSRVYRGEHLGAIRLAVGGIGTGSIQIDGKARRPAWQVFNNMPQVAVPDSFFAVRAKAAGGRPVLRALQTEPVGPFAAMKALSFRGEYPFGWFDFEDDGLCVRVSLEAFNPLIPLDVRSSGIPCAIYNVTVANPHRSGVEVALLATQQNAAGFRGDAAIKGRACGGYGANRNLVIRKGGATVLHMTTGKPADAPGFGDMALAVLDEKATASAAWESPEALAADLGGDGALSGPAKAGPTGDGKTVDGALASSFTLAPGERRTVCFILTWHFPNARHGRGAWGGPGNTYADWWPNALAVAEEVVRRLGELSKQTRLYHDTLYASNLPVWLLDRLSSQLVVIRSQTTFWTKAGYFGGWEGCCRSRGCCHGNCNHVWHYAQAHARLFPKLGRILREQELRFQGADGAIPHRQPRSHPAFDGQCGGILGAYREHLLSSDGAWLARHWPNVKRAMDFVIATWDKDGDGVLAGAQWNTLDGNLGGSTSWLGTLYLAALAAAEKMALLQGDRPAAERYRSVRRSGSKKQDAALFNGEYYIQVPDDRAQQDYRDGCHIDQVLGQWWADQLDLGPLYPPEHVRTALRSLFKYNFRPRLRGYRQAPRKFVHDDDPGMQMITWPKGERPAGHMRYADEVMSGFEYSAAAAMVYAGLLREGFTVVRAASIRYDGRLRTGLTASDTASWGYSGNPFGDDECGKFYARPMSVWSMLLACQGFVCDGPAGVIGFRPAWKAGDHVSFFSAAEGWGLFTQKRGDGEQTERIDVRCGTLCVKTLIFELPEGAKPSKVSVAVGDRAIRSAHECEGATLTVSLSSRATVREGQTMTITAQW